jgi:hypothetical protein
MVESDRQLVITYVASSSSAGEGLLDSRVPLVACGGAPAQEEQTTQPDVMMTIPRHPTASDTCIASADDRSISLASETSSVTRHIGLHTLDAPRRRQARPGVLTGGDTEGWQRAPLPPESAGVASTLYPLGLDRLASTGSSLMGSDSPVLILSRIGVRRRAAHLSFAIHGTHHRFV